jgi:response regulator RpfG family c-di-GMP phosphodiesterase
MHLIGGSFAYCLLGGVGAGYEYYFFPIGAGSYLVWPNNRKHQLVLTSASFLLFMYISVAEPGGLVISKQWNTTLVYYLFLINSASSFISSFVVLHTLAMASERTQKILDDLEKRAVKKADIREGQMLHSLNALAKARDNETGNHIIRTQNYVKALALRLRSEGHFKDELSDDAIDSLFRAAPLHDLGKIGIPDSILLKEGKLSDEEWVVMRTHPLIGESVLNATNIDHDLRSEIVEKAIKVAGGHHEKWDGSGYPRGLAGRAIPLEARIMALADMYDALLSVRPYKKAWTHEQAVEEIISKRGTHFDPILVDIFMAEQEAFKEIAAKYKD